MQGRQHTPTDGAFRAFLAAQSLTTFNHNLLRAALLTLVPLRGLTAFGLSVETVVGLATLLVVLPYVVLSLPAGRIADRFSRTAIIDLLMALDIVVLALGAIGLLLLNLPMLLVALLLAGVQAALLGPAKFAILPDLVPAGALIRSNGLASAAGTATVLLGTFLGSALILDPAGQWLVALGALLLSGLALYLSRRVPPRPAEAPHLPLDPGAMLSDLTSAAQRLAATPAIGWPLVGTCWFWFQGAACTAMIPLYVAATGQPAIHVALLLLASAGGVGLGAMLANPLLRRLDPLLLSLAIMPVMALSGLDFVLTPPLGDTTTIIRLALDAAIMSAGSGFYLVPLTSAIQQLTPPEQRARFVGISHTLSGLAMCGAGLSIIAYPHFGLSVTDLYLLLALVGAVVAALSLYYTLVRGGLSPAPRRRPHRSPPA